MDNIVCAKCAGRGYYFASESSIRRTPCPCQENPIKALINAVYINAANLNHIASSGKINGTMMVEIERIMSEYAFYYASQFREPSTQGEKDAYSAGLMCERILAKDEIERLKQENDRLKEVLRDSRMLLKEARIRLDKGSIFVQTIDEGIENIKQALNHKD